MDNDTNSENMTSTVAQPRESGIELLRLLAVFSILAFHSNFYALGAPERPDFCAAPIISFLRTFAEFATLVCVDVFVLISGWFGIRPKAKRILGLWFQCGFFCVLLYMIGLAAGIPVGTKRGALANLFWVGKWNWFIKSYVGLYLFAPVLNAFAESAQRKAFARVVIAFFAFQTAFWLFPMSHHDFIQNGFSSFSFMGLYLLGRFVRIHRPRFATHHWGSDTAVFFVIVFLESALFILNRFFRIPHVDLLDYSSPLAIASSLFVLLWFSKLHFRSKAINALGRLSYSPYLLQTHPSVAMPLFYPAVAFAAGMPLAEHWLVHEDQVWIIPTDAGGWPMSTVGHLALVLIVLLVFFFVAILLDWIRLVLWKAITTSFPAAPFPLARNRAFY